MLHARALNAYVMRSVSTPWHFYLRKCELACSSYPSPLTAHSIHTLDKHVGFLWHGWHDVAPLAFPLLPKSGKNRRVLGCHPSWRQLLFAAVPDLCAQATGMNQCRAIGLERLARLRTCCLMLMLLSRFSNCSASYNHTAAAVNTVCHSVKQKAMKKGHLVCSHSVEDERKI